MWLATATSFFVWDCPFTPKNSNIVTVPKADNIFLVGPMGVGKTTIGRRLAKKLDKKFIDSDKEIEKRTGASISLIFDVEGERGFRDRESRLLEELTAEDGIVLATGGGAVLAESNRNILSARGIVIYLTASPELLMKRTAHDHNRPLLMTGNRLATIRQLLDERDSVYRAVADLCLNIDKLSVKEIIDQVSTYLKTI
jgi:shikimate kinase